MTTESITPPTEPKPDADPPAERPVGRLGSTPFERYFFTDARPGFPMTYPLEFELAEPLDRRRLAAALDETLARHPLLTATMNGRDWSLGAAAPTRCEWFASDPASGAEFDQSVALPIDARVESPLRLRLCERGDGVGLQLIVHHSASDGLGLMQFLGDLFKTYYEADGGDQPSPRKPRRRTDPREALAKRSELTVTPPAPVSWWRAWRFTLAQTCRFALTRPVVLGSRRAGAEPPGPTAMATAELVGEPLEAFVARAADLGVTTNTLLLAVAFHTLARFKPRAERGRFVRITLPINLRQRQDLRLPAANKIGYAFVDRKLNDCHDPLGLIAGLQAEIDAINDWSLAAMFLDAVAAVERAPRGLWLATRLAGGVSTAVFSNIGDVGRRLRLGGGGQRVTRVRGTPPLRPGTAVGLGFAMAEGRMSISVARDPNRLSADEARALADDFHGCCLRLAGGASAATQQPG